MTPAEDRGAILSAVKQAVSALHRAEGVALCPEPLELEDCARRAQAARLTLAGVIEHLQSKELPGYPLDVGPMNMGGLDALRRLDSPAARRFLEALRETEALAVALDRERGDVDALGHPSGWGELVGIYRLRAEGEILGPTQERIKE